jgi:hypothetical protein
MTDVFRIAQILVSHAAQRFKDRIAIIAYYGSRAKGTASPTSDLDLFYIPDDGAARSLSSQFVIGGLPYDFWPVSWKMAEDIANARSHRPWAVSASLIADTKVIFYRSQEDLDRFTALKARIEELTKPENREGMVQRALKEFEKVLFLLSQVRLARDDGDDLGFQWASLQFLERIINCLALVNQIYFSKGWGSERSQLLRLVQRPDNLVDLIDGIVCPVDAGAAVLDHAQSLTIAVRRILIEAQASLAAPLSVNDVFDSFYYYVFEYKNKVLAACERGDSVAAASAAYHMQEQIAQLMNQMHSGNFPTEMNLLGEYVGGYFEAGFPDLYAPASQGDLKALALQVQRLDAGVRDWLGEHSVDLNVFDTEEQLQKFLDRSTK